MLLKVYNIVFLTKITKDENMKRNTTKPDLPTLWEDILTDPQICADNMFADMWKSLKMNTLLNKAGFKKQSGTPINSVGCGSFQLTDLSGNSKDLINKQQA
jgi:hypothetical protein